MGSIFKIEERITMVGRAANQIRDAIVEGRLKPGERLVETELADEMGISRHPIREAIRHLESEGLVTTTPFKGAHVTKFTKKDIEEVFTFRVSLEELAIRTLVKHLTMVKIKQLESVLNTMRRLAAENDQKGYVDADLRFHQTICELSGHGRLLQAWRNLENQLRVFIIFADKDAPADIPADASVNHRLIDNWKEHLPIFEAVRDGNGDRAVQFMKKVLERGYAIALNGV